ncbi:hypothetical protein BD780_002888 [Clostridium tetanomorphum]|nr:hypothetical protein [Clostridium tetanomorphum]NRS85663.1 hypothetical protein [Clostridium tetanomorphum]NRZ96325.1 hypothetical protein [Clostridium tetanomorphum]SQC02609.1 Uncharacterised protein [Clostridium tetanomorphum]
MMILYILCSILLFFIVEYIMIRSSFKVAAYNNGQRRDVIIILGYAAKKTVMYHQFYENE